MRLYRATLETRHFHFQAFGTSRADARAALTNGFVIHASQFHIDPTWWHEFDEDIVTVPIHLGCYRDNQLLTSRRN